MAKYTLMTRKDKPCRQFHVIKPLSWKSSTTIGKRPKIYPGPEQES